MHKPVYYHPSINFGDWLSVWMYEKITGKAPETTRHTDKPHYIITGSILSEASDKSIVWGAGNARMNDKTPAVAKYCAVRGRATRARIKRQFKNRYQDIAVGDPALLLPDLYNPNIEVNNPLGIIPHWIDYYKVMTQYRGTGVKIINLLEEPEKVIDDILSCDKLISSSLHGLIAAHAYGKHCGWVIFSNKVLGDGFKFRDYFTSVEIPNHKVKDYSTKQPITKIMNEIPPHEITFDKKQLWDACPFKP